MTLPQMMGIERTHSLAVTPLITCVYLHRIPHEIVLFHHNS